MIDIDKRTIVLVPYKIDEKGIIYITPMLKSEVGKKRMGQLVNMGIFAKDNIPVTRSKITHKPPERKPADFYDKK